ncbi:MAG: hypothetical protein JWQ74_2637 [Marmoricola sp.]|nr:hypothetical protein [Marmoricola sp.]
MTFRSRLAVLTAVVLLPLSLAIAGPAEALTGVSGLKVITTGSKAPTTASLWFSWTWSSKPTKYVLQVSSDKTFKKDLRTKTVLRASKKPSGGVQTVQVASLTNATKYYARIKGTTSTSSSAWSSAKTGSTKARYPAAVTSFTTTPGPLPGEATISWKTSGDFTTGFRFVTSLTSYTKGQTGRMQKTTSFSASTRSKTFSASELTALGAPLASANFLWGRFYSDNKGTGGSATTELLGWKPVVAKGQAASGTGAPLVVANYNVRTFSATPNTGDYAWSNRVGKVVTNILTADPDILTLQEVSPAPLVTGLPATQSSSLLDELQSRQPGARHYVYGRSTPFTSTGSTPAGGTQAQRIVYDANKFTQVAGDTCNDAPKQASCAFDPGGDSRWATYLHLQSVADPTVTFWVVAAHPDPGRSTDTASETKRATEINGITAMMSTLAAAGEPVILGMDSNSWQTYPYSEPLSKTALLAAGYYDTSASANVANRLDNYKYSTDNTKWYGSTGVQKQTDGYAPRLDVIAVKNMPGSDDFEIDAHPTDPYPGSDHNLVRAEIKLPH